MKWLLSILAGTVVAGTLLLIGLSARDGRGRVTGAVELTHPPSAVFPLLVQPELRKQWLLGVESISAVGDSTLRSGARARVVLDVPERMDVEEELRVVETDKRILFQRSSSHPPFNQRTEYVLKDLGGGRTLVTIAVHTIYQGVLMNLVEPLLTRAAQTRMDAEIDQLRAAADATRPPVVALPVVSTPTVAVSPPPAVVPTQAPPAATAPETPAPVPVEEAPPAPPPEEATPAAPPVEEKPEEKPEAPPPPAEASPPSDQTTP